MAKTNHGTATGLRLLSDVVKISRQFLRSVRIDADYGREDALSGYVCQGTARSLLENMARQLSETRQRAFTWTGPYGGGKSSLALMLCSLVGHSAKLRNKAKQILDLPVTGQVNRVFEASGSGWMVIPVVGKRGSVVAEISSAMSRSKGEQPSRRKGFDAVAELVSAANQHRQGVLVIIDEMGKFLEATAQEGGDDIYFFQELAEAASRSRGKLVVVGILHQAFDAYASRLGREARDEWAKVQGRFVDIPLVAATDEVIELIGRAVVVDEEMDRKEAARSVDIVAKAIRTRRPGTAAGIATSIARCWPLHPVTAALLGPISKRRFGQNERSTFGFLASREPLGFVEFLEGQSPEWQSMYGPSRYWDYLRANLEPAILASPDGHRWSAAVEAVERAEAKGELFHVALTKTVALIEMFRNGSGLVAEEAILRVSVQGFPEESVHSALKDLIDWKILIERRHLGAYGVFAGSDFDIEGAIKQARGEIEVPELGQVSALSDLQPILAKRLYQETGTMRWFTRRIVRLGNLEQTFQKFKADRASVGSFILCLPEQDRSQRAAEAQIRKASSEHSNLAALVGVPTNAHRIAELNLELAAAERVMSTRPELEGDSVARRELVGRIAAVRSSLADELADAFSLAEWYSQGEKQPKHNVTSLSALASSIAELRYPKAPHIFSELINREEPSSNSNKARKDLMYRMVSHHDQAYLGYEGLSADAGLYHTVLQSSGLHRPRGSEGWSFGEANISPRGATIEALWNDTKALVSKPGKETTLSDIYQFWAAAPYGVRSGVMPVLALAFFLAHRSSLAMYVDGLFTPEMSEAAVDEWLLDSKRIRFHFVAASRDQARLVKAIAESVGHQSQIVGIPEPLDAARGLVGMVLALPGWTKRTATIGQTSQDVRAMLLKANDPHKVLFADLPTLLQVKEPAELVVRLRAVTAELSAAYAKMLEQVALALLSALDHTDREFAQLRLRAVNVKGITGDFRLDAFAARLEAFDGSPGSIEGLVSLAVSKPSANWVDRDIDAALVQLYGWAIDFRKAEAMAHLRGRTAMRRVIGVVFGASHGQDASGSVDLAESDVPAVDQLVKRVLATVQTEKPEVVLAALAEAGALLIQRRTYKEAA